LYNGSVWKLNFLGAILNNQYKNQVF
jgi:hypothetical protein